MYFVDTNGTFGRFFKVKLIKKSNNNLYTYGILKDFIPLVAYPKLRYFSQKGKTIELNKHFIYSSYNEAKERYENSTKLNEYKIIKIIFKEI